MAAPIRAVHDVLARLRAERSTWVTVDQRTRTLALIGLQYDRREDDIALCRFLLEREIEAAEDESEGDELKLACFLVACARNPDDIWLMHRAKHANYDTFSGLDREYLLAAGVERTIDHVRKSAHPDRERVLGELVGEDGAPQISEAELLEWWRWVITYFPARPEDEALYVAERALDYGTPEEAVAMLESWVMSDERELDRASEVAAAIVKAEPALTERVRALDFLSQ